VGLESGLRTSGGSPPELGKVQRAVWLGLDRQGWVQAVGGAVIGLIALFSSYDHIHIFSRSIRLDQQWGVWLIAASLAVVLV
jgi:hypothetical protein